MKLLNERRMLTVLCHIKFKSILINLSCVYFRTLAVILVSEFLLLLVVMMMMMMMSIFNSFIMHDSINFNAQCSEGGGGGIKQYFFKNWNTYWNCSRVWVLMGADGPWLTPGLRGGWGLLCPDDDNASADAAGLP